MKARLLDVNSRAVLADINCVIRNYQDPEGDLSGEEGVFDLVREHTKIGVGPATLALEDGRSAPVVVEKLKREADTGSVKGIFWLLDKPKKGRSS